jgi:hypothetical protein
MSVTVVRYRTKPDRADENQALIEKVFGALAADNPGGLRYASFRLADGVSFVHVAGLETDDGTNPLLSTPAFSDFVAGIKDRVEEGPVSSEATMVGSYRFWPDAADAQSATD